MKKPPPDIPARADIAERIQRAVDTKKTVVITRAPLRQAQWDAALHRPLPRSSSYELLDDHRKNLIEYLDWATHTGILCDKERALQTIQHLADRLTRITFMLPDALERGIKDGRLQLSDDVPF